MKVRERFDIPKRDVFIENNKLLDTINKGEGFSRYFDLMYDVEVEHISGHSFKILE